MLHIQTDNYYNFCTIIYIFTPLLPITLNLPKNSIYIIIPHKKTLKKVNKNTFFVLLN